MNNNLHKISRAFLNANTFDDFLTAQFNLLTYFDFIEKYYIFNEKRLRDASFTNSLNELNTLKTAEELYLYGIVPTAAIIIGTIHSVSNNRFDLDMQTLLFGALTLLQIECTIMKDKFNESDFSKFKVD